MARGASLSIELFAPLRLETAIPNAFQDISYVKVSITSWKDIIETFTYIKVPIIRKSLNNILLETVSF